MSEFIQISVAVDSEEGAHRIAETLVSGRLAASCWVSGPITSRYWWKGVVEKAQEWVCTAKTRGDLYGKVEQAITEVHPYEVPGILATPVEAGSQAYFDWINRETEAKSQQEQRNPAKEQIIQELIEAHEQLIATASAANERGARRFGETWGPREVLAHVAGWEEMAVSRMPHIIAGMPPVKFASIAQHQAQDDAINATIIAMIGNQSFDEICKILRQAYQRDAQMLRELDDAFFFQRTMRMSAQKPPSSTATSIFVASNDLAHQTRKKGLDDRKRANVAGSREGPREADCCGNGGLLTGSKGSLGAA